MKIDVRENLKKATNAVGKAGTTVGKAAGKSAGAIKNTTVGMVAKVKEESIKTKQRKLNPLFPEEYHSSSFHIPNLVVIVDDAVRRDEILCEGAVGWRNTVKDVEVLYLYDEFVPESGLSFVPAPYCDIVYYIDPHDRNNFIQVESLFDWAQKEKLGELANIASCLGAKRYSVQMFEESTKKSTAHFKNKSTAEVLFVNAGDEEELKVHAVSASKSKSLANVEFEEAREPVPPELCWFKNDKTICEIIRQRCSGRGALKQIDIELAGSDYATMSANTSIKIDAVIKKIGGHQNARIEASSAEERSHKFLFHLEF